MSIDQFIERPKLQRGSPTANSEVVESTWSIDRLDRQHSATFDNSIVTQLSENYFSNGFLKIDYQETQGYNTPSFKSLQAKKELLPYTPFFQTESKGYLSGTFGLSCKDYDQSLEPHGPSYHVDRNVEIDCSTAFLPSDTLNHHMVGYNDLSGLSAVSDSYSAAVQVQAAAAKIYSSGFDALTSGAEFHKTVRLFLGLKKRLIRELSRGRLYNLWLEGRYGWRILIFELIELDDAIRNFSKQREVYTDFAFGRFNASDSQTSSLEDILVPYPSNWTDGAKIACKYRYDLQRKISLKGSVTGHVQPAQFSANPFVTAWELIPYSFVIDWFVDLGKWISAMSFDASATKYVAAEGIKVEETLKLTAVEHEFSNSASWRVSDASRPGLLIDGAIVRSYTARSPTRLDHTPHFNSRLDAFKVADLVALLLAGKRR